MANQDNDYPSLFSKEEQVPIVNQPDAGPVTVLGITFDNDAKRREYFREELRKKLPELRNIEGFPIGPDDDIINLSDPPYYTACPNPWLNDFIAQWEEEKKELVKQGKRQEEFEVKEPYASDVSEGKGNSIYMAHSYHTKCPHPAIMRYILHYTQPGDIVFDGFAGSGMTGVASNLCGNEIEATNVKENGNILGHRFSICSDLSPFASHLSNCYNSPVNSLIIEKELQRIYDEVVSEYGWMYETKDQNGNVGKIGSVVWSNIYVCPSCGNEVTYWDAAVDMEGKKILDDFECPYCKAKMTKKNSSLAMESAYDELIGEVIPVAKSVPSLIVYSDKNNKRHERKASSFDLQVIEKINNTPFPNCFIPSIRMPEGGETRRNDKSGITHVHHFYTKRNLIALSVILDKINKSSYRRELLFVFTSMITRSTKMNRFSARNYFYGGGGWAVTGLSGTLYVPAMPMEISVLEQLKGKISFYKNIGSLMPKTRTNITHVVSATNCMLNGSSVDYMFIDPPFGANLAYSELSSITEAWLKVMTDNRKEAIVSDSQNKSIFEYQTLMNESFREFYRVLKPGKWLTMEFSNTSASVWNSIQNALQGVGFVVANVAALDKKQGSFKAVTTTTAVKQDLVITCYKPSDELTDKMEDYSKSADNVWDFIDEYLLHLPVHIERNNATTTVIERSPKILFDRLISYYVVKGYPVPLDATDFQVGLRERYIERDGMFFPASQAAEYDEKKKSAPEFVPMGIIVSDEANGIEWLKNKLRDCPKTYQDIQPDWIQAINGIRKGDILPELATLLEENFIEMEDGKWRLPNIQDDVDKEALRNKALLKEFKIYVETAQKPKAKIKEARVEALRAGFKQCWADKDFQTIVTVGDKIPQNLLTEDEVLLQFYDIAQNKI